MSHHPHDVEDRRGLRFPFDGEAEIFLETPRRKLSARVTELSFRGCFVQVSSTFKPRQRLRLKIRQADDSLEASVAVLFDELEQQALNVLQDWILNALDVQAEAERQQQK